MRAPDDEERQQRVARALANPVYFGEVYVRPFDSHWVSALPGFGRRMLQFALSARRGVVILPPEFLKTTLLSQVLPLWLTVRATVMGEMLRGMLLSEEEDMAINNLGVVKWHIQNNDLLATDFADERGRPLVYPDPEEQTWREDAIVVNRHGTSKDPTWEAKGLNSTGIQGRRIDWLIGDDVITPASAFSPAKREKALRDWDMQITTRLVEDGRAIVAGNFNDPEDLVSTLSKRPSYKVFKRPALHKPNRPSVPAELEDEDAVVLWPENWSRERLAGEAEEKPTRFRRIFLLDVSGEQGRKLRVEWVRFVAPEQVPWRYSRYFISLDPAPGGDGDDLDFFNVSVGAMHEHGLDLVDSVDVRASTPDQCALVGALHDRYQRLGTGVFAIGGAKIAMDRYMRGALTIARPDLEHKLVEIGVSDTGKEARLEALGPYARGGWLRVLDELWDRKTSNLEDRWQELTLHQQWQKFPASEHDDKLDGLDVLIRTSREFEGVGDVEYVMQVAE